MPEAANLFYDSQLQRCGFFKKFLLNCCWLCQFAWKFDWFLFSVTKKTQPNSTGIVFQVGYLTKGVAYVEAKKLKTNKLYFYVLNKGTINKLTD